MFTAGNFDHFSGSGIMCLLVLQRAGGLARRRSAPRHVTPDSEPTLEARSVV